MKVLFLHQHLKLPCHGGALRSYYLARALVNQGHEVIFLSAHQAPYQKQCYNGIEIHWFSVPYKNEYGFIARIFSFLKFNLKVKRGIHLIQKVDLCYAISVPLTIGIAAMRLKRKYGIPFIFETGDLWPDVPIALGFIKNPLLIKWLKQLELKIYEASEAIVVLSPTMRTIVSGRVPHKKVYLIPTSSDTDFFKPTESKANTGNFTISYVGAMGFANGLEYYLRCAEASQKEGLPIQFVMAGIGGKLKALKTLAKELKLTNFTILPFQNKEGVKSILDRSEASFISFRPESLLATGCPNKYFDGLASGKLIVANFGGWLGDEITKRKCGICVDPFNPLDFVHKISLFVRNPQMLSQYQHASRLLAENAYSRKQLENIFTQILARHIKLQMTV